MWKLIKKCFAAYIEAQTEINKTGIIIIPSWYMMIYYIDPEKNDKSKSLSKDH